MNKLPTKLFRFFPPEASDFFATKKMWFSNVSDFNDPFELRPRYDSTLKAKFEDRLKMAFAFSDPRDRISWPQFKKQYQQQIEQWVNESMDIVAEELQQSLSKLCGMICFVGNEKMLTDMLTWGHYSKGHRGFVIEFDPNHSFFQTDGEKDRFKNVEYKPHRPEYDVGFYEFAFTKSSDWIEESEWRLLKVVTRLLPGKRRDNKDKNRWCLDLPPTMVRAVYFGCRMPAPNEKELFDVLKLPEWRHVETFKMCLHPTDYSLGPKPIAELKPISKEIKEKFMAAQADAENKLLNETEREWIKRVT